MCIAFWVIINETTWDFRSHESIQSIEFLRPTEVEESSIVDLLMLLPVTHRVNLGVGGEIRFRDSAYTNTWAQDALIPYQRYAVSINQINPKIDPINAWIRIEPDALKILNYPAPARKRSKDTDADEQDAPTL